MSDSSSMDSIGSSDNYVQIALASGDDAGEGEDEYSHNYGNENNPVLYYCKTFENDQTGGVAVNITVWDYSNTGTIGNNGGHQVWGEFTFTADSAVGSGSYNPGGSCYPEKNDDAYCGSISYSWTFSGGRPTVAWTDTSGNQHQDTTSTDPMTWTNSKMCSTSDIVANSGAANYGAANYGAPSTSKSQALDWCHTYASSNSYTKYFCCSWQETASGSIESGTVFISSDEPSTSRGNQGGSHLIYGYIQAGKTYSDLQYQ